MEVKKMIIEKKKLSDLTPAPYNPRISTKKDEANLQASLIKFGIVEPIIFNKQTGYIVGGHFRVRELKKLGFKEVECVIVDLDEEDEKELNIRLNANTGQWDWENLANEWDENLLNEWGLNVEKFNYEDFKEDQDKPKPATLKIKFESEEELQKAEVDILELLDRKYPSAKIASKLFGK